MSATTNNYPSMPNIIQDRYQQTKKNWQNHRKDGGIMKMQLKAKPQQGSMQQKDFNKS